MSRRARLALLACLLGCASGAVGGVEARASEFYPIYRSPRFDAMGGASVAIVEDEAALYLNPAGLAGVKDFQLNYLVADIDASDDAIFKSSSVASALQGGTGESLNAIMGKDIYSRVTASPILMGPNLAAGFFYDGQLALRSENKALPQIVAGYQTTQGVQLGWATTLGGSSGKGRRARANRMEYRIGIAGKLMGRRGGYRLVPVSTLLQMSVSDLKGLFNSYAVGYGLDVGAQAIYRSSANLKLMAGFAATDVGDTTFGNGPQPSTMNVSIGAGLRYDFGGFGLIAAYDMRNLLQAADWRKKNHLGLELALPMLSLYGGLNQVYLTYGLSFDAWLFRVTASSYCEEQGGVAFQDPERRYAVRIGLKFNL